MSWLLTQFTQYGFFIGVPLALLAIVAWIYRPGARRRYQDDGRIPFDEK